MDFVFQRSLLGGHYLSQLIVFVILLLLVIRIKTPKRQLFFLLLPIMFIPVHEVIWNTIYILYFRPDISITPLGWPVVFCIFIIITVIDVYLMLKTIGYKPLFYSTLFLVTYNLIYYVVFGPRLSVNIFLPNSYEYFYDLVANIYEIGEVAISFSLFIYLSYLTLKGKGKWT